MKEWKYLPNKEKQRIKDLLEKIRFETAQDSKCYIPEHKIKYIEKGTLLCTAGQMGNFGPDKNVLKYIGYTCQIRLGYGGFGSDEVYLRHLDEDLTPHSEQTFYKINRKNSKKLMKLFGKMITQEKAQIWDKDYFYRSFEGVKKYGYLVEKESNFGRPNV